MVFGFNTLPVVAHSDTDLSIVKLRHRHVDRLGSAMANRVCKQINDRLLDPNLVDLCTYAGATRLKLCGTVCHSNLGGELFEYSLYQSRHISLCDPNRKLPGANTRHIRHIIDQAHDTIELALVVADHRIDFFACECTLCIVFQHQPARVQL